MSGSGRLEQTLRPLSARFPFRSSILLKQTVFVALVMILSGGTLILVGNEYVQNMVRDQIDQQLVLAASDRQKLLLAYIRQQQERVALVASRTRLRQLIDEFETGNISSEAFQVDSKRILEDARSSTEGFLAISITDLQGKVITATDEMALGRDYSEDPDFLEGRDGSHLGLPRLNGGNDQALLTAPATTHDDRHLGVVIVLLDISPMVEFMTDTTGLGESGQILIGTRRGDQVHYLLPPRGGGQIIDVPLDTAPAMGNAIRGETGFVRTQDYRGVEVLAAYRPVGYRDWGMVAVIDVNEAYAPLVSLRLLLIILEAGLLLIGVVVSYLLARHYTQPILEMASKATAVAEGDLSVRVPIRTKDEIGILAESFNRMTEQLASSYATLEQRILERTTELEAANRELEAFSYSVSHDLRAPLRSIDGFSQAMLEDYADKLDPQGRGYLQRMRAASQRMAQLIDDMLELSRITRAELRREKVDLSAMAKAIAADLKKSQPKRQAEFVIADRLVVEGDPRLMRVALENLLDNAWKFTSKHPRATIEVGAIQQDGSPAYFVRDDGVGFDMAYADKLFSAFQRLHAVTEFAGTGIGLATVQRIIHRHGGQVWAEGAVEKGATFYFTL